MKQASSTWKAGLAWLFVSSLFASRLAVAQVFTDNFTRTNDPAPPAPWNVQAGNWVVTGGAMDASASSANNYAYAYITNSYSDYSVQAQVRCSTNNAWGGGVGGRLDPATGAHYAAWLYPDNSGGGGNALRLVKFTSYTTFGYNGANNFAFMGATNLASVGTNYHTVLLSMLGSQITVSYDGAVVISVADTDSSAPVYTNGAVSLDLYEDDNAYTLFVDNVSVSLLSNAPQANNDAYNATRGVPLTVLAPGVLANDTGGAGPLSAILLTNVSHGTLTLSTNGGFTYLSATNFTGTDTWYYAATDGVTNSNPAKVTMNVTPPVPPVASNDTYTVSQAQTLNVAAPGVLANDTGGSGPLHAVLGTGPTHGTLNLNTNGGFAYTPTNTFTGSDSFTYRANDGATNSNLGTVTITVTPDSAPVAVNDAYGLSVNTPLSVPAPGVLANDSQANGNALTAVLVTGPTNGTLTLTNNGGFTYTPAAGFNGQDSFVYRATDGISNSVNATVTLSILPQGTLFFDDFARGTDPGPLTPWVAALGTAWTVTGGALLDTNELLGSYAYATMPTNSWTNYVFQAQVQFGSNGYGGGIGSCLNPATGSHYAAWVYPGGSTGGSNVLKLFKFGDYQDFSTLNTPVSIPAVGTNLHTLKLAVFNGQVAAYFDGALVVTVADPTGTPYAGGSIAAERWTDATNYNFSIRNALVSGVVVGAGYAMNGLEPLVVAAPGVLANDTEVFGTTLTASLVTGTSNGVLTLNADGSFTYTANSGFSGVDTFTYQATDGATVLGVGTVTITVESGPGAVFSENFDEVTAPALPTGWTTTSTVGSNWVTQTSVRDTTPNAAYIRDVTNNATSDLISPTFALPPGPNQITFRHEYNLEPGDDGGTLAIKIGTNAFTDILAAGGVFLAGGYNTTLGSDGPLKGTATWSGNSSGFVTSTADLPPAASGQTVQFRWRLGTDTLNGSTSYTGWYVDSIIVSNCPASSCWNTPPALGVVSNRTVNQFSLLTVTNTAVDSDTPAQTLTYSLLTKPTNAVISTNGIITWTPAGGQAPSTNTFTTRVVDNGTPALSATNTFSVIVFDVNLPPTLPAQTNRTTIGLATLVVTNTATDSNVPPATLSYTLLSAPTGAAISTNGIISWTPVAAEVPGTNVFTTVVSNFNAQALTNQRLSATNSFTVVVSTQHFGPSLPPQGNRTIFATFPLVVTNTAIDSDIPALTLNYQLLAPPAGASIGTNGVITWTPTLSQGPSTNIITTVVSDSGTPSLSATNAFSVTVIPPIPILTSNSAVLIAEGCYPTNGAIDPGETVTVSFGFQNVGGANSANLVVTLLETNGVISPSAPQNYGVVVTNGAPVTRAFSFIAGGICGGAITNVFQFQDGASNYGTVSMVLPLGPVGTVFSQTFDAVTRPGLPAGWATATSGAEAAWITTNTFPDTGRTNVAFAPDVPAVGINELDSPQIVLPAGASQLSFRHFYNLEASTTAGTGFDGGVLEIKIGTNAYADILTAGGTFVSNGYNNVISTQFGNPLTNRHAWSSNSIAYVTTIVDLPAAAANQTVQFRWRVGCDSNNISSSANPGWRIASVAVNGHSCCVATAPALAALPDATVTELSTLVVTNTASDPEVPPLVLTYSLIAPPAGAVIDTNGIISWTPAVGQGPSTNTFTTVVTDNNSPPLSATNSFNVVVEHLNFPPILPAQPDFTIAGLATITVTNTAIDTNVPPASLAYGLLAAPPNAVISSDGVITWAPVLSQVPSVNVFTTVVTNFNPLAFASQSLTATNSFTVTVNAIHNGPALPALPNRTVNEFALLIVTNTASDSDIPPYSLAYQLVNPPAGAAIDPNGIIRWTPGEGQGLTTNVFTTVVSDSATPSLSATNSFAVVINVINVPPFLPAQTNRTINPLVAMVVTNTATDTNIPAATLTYGLLASPTNAVIDASGIITWTPTFAQAPGTNVFTTVVTNFNQYAVNAQRLTATNSFTVFVNPAPPQTGPSIQSITLNGGVATISWATIPGHTTYVLQFTDNLSSTNWSQSDPITAAGASGSATNAIGTAPSRFYRVLAE